MQVRRKDVCIFINRAVLDHGLSRFPDLDDMPEPAVQEENLEIERPPLHVFIKTMQVGIGVHILEMCFPFQVLGKQSGKGCFS